MWAKPAPASRPEICWAFAAGTSAPKSASNAMAPALSRHMHDQRLARRLLPLLVALFGLSLPVAAQAKPNVQAGAAVLHGTYRGGHSARQYASTPDGGYGRVGPAPP